MLNREQTNQFYQLWESDNNKYYHHCILYHLEGHFVAYDLTALDIIRIDEGKANVIKVLGYFEPYNPNISTAELRVSFLYHNESGTWILWNMEFIENLDFNRFQERNEQVIPFSNLVFE